MTDPRGQSSCPVCQSKSIRKDRLYPLYQRVCLDCKSEWMIETGHSLFEIIYNPRKEIFL